MATTTNDESAPIGYLLCDDLMFGSRILATAKACGIVLRTARDSQTLERMWHARPGRLAILDLANAGARITDLMPMLRGDSGAFIVGYGSHVDTAMLRQARDAGCDLVLPRSKLVEDLPSALPKWFGLEQADGIGAAAEPSE